MRFDVIADERIRRRPARARQQRRLQQEVSSDPGQFTEQHERLDRTVASCVAEAWTSDAGDGQISAPSDDGSPGAQSGRKQLSQIRFGMRPRQIEIRFGERINQRTDHVGAAHCGTARGPDIRDQSIEKDDLSIEEYNRDLRPVLRV